MVSLRAFSATSFAVFALVAISGCSSNGTANVGPTVADAAPSTEADSAARAQTNDRDAAARDAKSDASTLPPLACDHESAGTFIEVLNNPNGTLHDAEGGALLDGHYQLKHVAVVSAALQPDIAADLWVQEGRYEWHTQTSDGKKSSLGGEISTSGTRIETTVDCGGGAPLPEWQYTAVPNTVIVSFTKDGVGWVYTLFRRPG